MTRIAINGFGRIGRSVLRVIQKYPDLQVVAINDLSNIESMAYLLKYDSVHGRIDGDINIDNNYIVFNGSPIFITSEKNIDLLPWKLLEVDVVIESTGFYLTRSEVERHLHSGAKKVLVTAPLNNADATICYGINNDSFRKKMRILSMASCTTNCLASIVKVLQDKFTIENAFATTIHSYTNDQRLLDCFHEDQRRSRAAGLSIIPTTTGAVKAISLIFPELTDKFDGFSIRVPTPNVSCVDLTAVLSQKTTTSELNKFFQNASNTYLKNILGYTEDPIVSVDIRGMKESAILDASFTKVLNGNLIKILSWYDNEWGFSNRVVDFLHLF